MADTFDYEGDDDIVSHYENRESDGARNSNPHEMMEGATSDNDVENKTGTAQRSDSPVASKTHVTRNLAPRLNTERLKGRNGIHTIEKYFEGFKFYGKGHEKTDLDRVMKRLEHWSHRLFSKYHFDDFLTRVEQLGTKKDLQVFIKKYRLDMLVTDDDSIVRDNMDNEEDQPESVPLDDFDLLITEQIQKQKEAETRALTPDVVPSTSSEDAFNKLMLQSDVVPSSQVQSANATKNELSDETREKIQRNKQLAIQRRLQRQKEREEDAKRRKLFEGTNSTPSENNDATVNDGTDMSQADDVQSRINESISEVNIVNSPEEVPLIEEPAIKVVPE